ncbi:MAG: hypothetical protein HRU71_09990 [Planctomycetia bacterium]|nr:MAG: hypothetical protein HRU71_09990 [Planctomycetia bacterium]
MEKLLCVKNQIHPARRRTRAPRVKTYNCRNNEWVATPARSKGAPARMNQFSQTQRDACRSQADLYFSGRVPGSKSASCVSTPESDRPARIAGTAANFALTSSVEVGDDGTAGIGSAGDDRMQQTQVLRRRRPSSAFTMTEQTTGIARATGTVVFLAQQDD